MAEDRTETARLHCREPVSLLCERCVPNRVHAVVEAVEATGLCAAVDAGARKAAADEFRRREHTVIASGQLCHLCLRAERGRFVSHTETKRPSVEIRPLGAQSDPTGASLNSLPRLR
jgi:hypothetical protein